MSEHDYTDKESFVQYLNKTLKLKTRGQFRIFEHKGKPVIEQSYQNPAVLYDDISDFFKVWVESEGEIDFNVFMGCSYSEAAKVFIKQEDNILNAAGRGVEYLIESGVGSCRISDTQKGSKAEHNSVAGRKLNVGRYLSNNPRHFKSIKRDEGLSISLHLVTYSNARHDPCDYLFNSTGVATIMQIMSNAKKGVDCKISYPSNRNFYRVFNYGLQSMQFELSKFEPYTVIYSLSSTITRGLAASCYSAEESYDKNLQPNFGCCIRPENEDLPRILTESSGYDEHSLLVSYKQSEYSECEFLEVLRVAFRDIGDIHQDCFNKCKIELLKNISDPYRNNRGYFDGVEDETEAWSIYAAVAGIHFSEKIITAIDNMEDDATDEFLEFKQFLLDCNKDLKETIKQFVDKKIVEYSQ